MGVMIELTQEQEQAVLTAYNNGQSEPTPPNPVSPPRGGDEKPLVVVNQSFEDFYGFPFGKADPDAGKKLPFPACSSANGLMTWKMYVGGDLALELGVSTYGGGINIHTVADELAKWPPGKGYEDIIAQIEAMGLDDTDFAVFPQDGPRHVELQGVAWGGADWKLEMWQQGEVRHTLTGPGLTPPEECRFTLAESGQYLPLHYYWK